MLLDGLSTVEWGTTGPAGTRTRKRVIRGFLGDDASLLVHGHHPDSAGAYVETEKNSHRLSFASGGAGGALLTLLLGLLAAPDDLGLVVLIQP